MGDTHTTIRGIVAATQVEIRDADLPPHRAAELLNMMTSLLGSCNEAIRTADMKYMLVYKTYLDSMEKANRAKIAAECSDEFMRKCEARDAKGEVEALIAALKYYLRSAENEMRFTR